MKKFETYYPLLDTTYLHWYQKIQMWFYCLYLELRYKQYKRYKEFVKVYVKAVRNNHED